MNKLLTILLTFVILTQTITYAQETYPFNGLKDERSTVHAFTNATIFIENGEYLNNAIIVIEKDKIVSLSR